MINEGRNEELCAQILHIQFPTKQTGIPTESLLLLLFQFILLFWKLTTYMHFLRMLYLLDITSHSTQHCCCSIKEIWLNTSK